MSSKNSTRVEQYIVITSMSRYIGRFSSLAAGTAKIQSKHDFYTCPQMFSEPANHKLHFMLTVDQQLQPANHKQPRE